MKKTYQIEVIELAKNMIDSLNESGFFKEYEIENTNIAEDILCELLTQKFIEGKLNNGAAEFEDDELMSVLNLIIAASSLESLKEKGYVNSFEDEDGEERYFLTESGKQMAKLFGLDN